MMWFLFFLFNINYLSEKNARTCDELAEFHELALELGGCRTSLVLAVFPILRICSTLVRFFFFRFGVLFSIMEVSPSFSSSN